MRFTRTEPLHILSIVANSVIAAGLLSRGEITARFFEQERRQTSTEGRIEYREPGERTIGGQTYPVLGWRFTPASGTPVLDGLLLLYFSDDFEERQRLHLLMWLDTHSAEAPPKALDEFDALVASFSVRPVGTVLLSDDFEDSSVGVLPTTAREFDRFPRGYVDGEYMIQKADPGTANTAVAQAPQTFVDLAAAVDVRFASETPDQYVELACRRVAGPEGSNGYYLIVNPDRGRFRLIRRDKGTIHPLVQRESPAINPAGAINRLELTCAGTTIAASINGAPVAAVRDATHVQGAVAIAAGAPSGSTAEARFDNLVVLQK